jgi:hypothetical protein
LAPFSEPLGDFLDHFLILFVKTMIFTKHHDLQ